MQLTGVTKKLGDFNLNIDHLSVKEPGIYGVIGANGCGKSTLAKIMAGLLSCDSGSVDTEGLSEREITFLSRKPYMMDDTVYNNLVYPLGLRKINPDSQLIEKYLYKMNLTKRAKQRAKSLSGGEQQKLAFLRALIFKPKFIIADEAMTAMDMDSLDHFEEIIMEEQEKEKSIWIVISHQMPHIKRLCNKIFFMHDGRIEIQADAQEIFKHVDNPHLGKYLRSYNG